MSRLGPFPSRIACAAGAIGFLFSPVSPTHPAVDDGSLVYCLERQPDLVRAAIALDVGQAGAGVNEIRISGPSLTIKEWRDADPAGFARSCAALRAAGNQPRAGPNTATQPLITGTFTLMGGILGVLVTWWVGERREKINRLRQEAEDLRAAIWAYDSTVRLYTQGWLRKTRGTPSESDVAQRAIDIGAHLRRIGRSQSKWAQSKLLNRLSEPPLGEYLLDVEEWRGLAQSDRAPRADEVFSALAAFTRDAEEVAHRHETRQSA
jgi:hypothetical protein